MKKQNFLASLLLSTLVAVIAFDAAYAGTEQKKNLKPSRQAKLGTSFKFDGRALRGKYQSALGTRAKVENDKSLDDLLNGRTQFEDRIQQDSEKN